MARVAHPADANLGHAGEGAQKSSDKSHWFVGALEGTGELSENVWVLEHVGTCWNIVRYLEQGLMILMSDTFGPWKLHDAAFAYQRHFQPRRISL